MTKKELTSAIANLIAFFDECGEAEKADTLYNVLTSNKKMADLQKEFKAEMHLIICDMFDDCYGEHVRGYNVYFASDDFSYCVDMLTLSATRNAIEKDIFAHFNESGNIKLGNGMFSFSKTFGNENIISMRYGKALGTCGGFCAGCKKSLLCPFLISLQLCYRLPCSQYACIPCRY